MKSGNTTISVSCDQDVCGHLHQQKGGGTLAQEPQGNVIKHVCRYRDCKAMYNGMSRNKGKRRRKNKKKKMKKKEKKKEKEYKQN